MAAPSGAKLHLGSDLRQRAAAVNRVKILSHADFIAPEVWLLAVNATVLAEKGRRRWIASVAWIRQIEPAAEELQHSPQRVG